VHQRLSHLTAWRRDDGVALVEFALILPVLLILLFGIIDFGKAFNYWIDQTHLANTGARYAAVNKNPLCSTAPCTGGQSLQAYIRSLTDTAELRNGGTTSVPSAVQVCITFPNGATAGQPVKISTSITYNWLPVLGLGATSSTVSSSATMRLEAAPTLYAAGCA
jgi:Flp pilus assembly protein TadG